MDPKSPARLSRRNVLALALSVTGVLLVLRRMSPNIVRWICQLPAIQKLGLLRFTIHSATNWDCDTANRME